MKTAKIESSDSSESLTEFELPDGWNLLTVGKISSAIQYGYTESAIQKIDGPRFLRITDIQDGRVNWDTVPSCEISKDDYQKFELKNGDIVFARTGATTGKSFLIQSCPNAVFASYLIRIRPNERVVPKFLHLFFQTPAYWQMISENVTGIAQPNCNASKLKNLPIPLPPFAEQQRIVARVEALLTHINVARDRLSRVPLIMKKFRQAVLAAACSGRLTEGWREENPDKLSTVDVTDFINANKQKISDPSEYSGDYPEFWIPIKIGDLFNNWGGATPSTSESSYWGGDIPWVSSKDIKSLRITQGSDFITKKALDGSRLRLSPIGSVIIVVRSGILAHTFPVAIADAEVVINQDIKAFYTPNQSLNEWLALFFRGQSQYILENIRKDGTTVQSIRFDDLKNMVLYIPSFDEQYEIVSRAGILFEHADAFDREVAAAGRRCERLTQAVLGKAFAGKL